MRYIYKWDHASGGWRLVELDRTKPMAALTERYYNGKFVALFLEENDLRDFALIVKKCELLESV